VLSRRARRRLVVAAALGVGGYAAYCAWRDSERLRRAVRSTAAELQRCSEAALTRTTACVVAGAVRGVAAVRPQVCFQMASAVRCAHHFDDAAFLPRNESADGDHLPRRPWRRRSCGSRGRRWRWKSWSAC
jgi:hypothetical protein